MNECFQFNQNALILVEFTRYMLWFMKELSLINRIKKQRGGMNPSHIIYTKNQN